MTLAELSKVIYSFTSCSEIQLKDFIISECGVCMYRACRRKKTFFRGFCSFCHVRQDMMKDPNAELVDRLKMAALLLGKKTRNEKLKPKN